MDFVCRLGHDVRDVRGAGIYPEPPGRNVLAAAGIFPAFLYAAHDFDGPIHQRRRRCGIEANSADQPDLAGSDGDFDWSDFSVGRIYGNRRKIRVLAADHWHIAYDLRTNLGNSHFSVGMPAVRRLAGDF